MANAWPGAPAESSRVAKAASREDDKRVVGIDGFRVTTRPSLKQMAGNEKGAEAEA